MLRTKIVILLLLATSALRAQPAADGSDALHRWQAGVAVSAEAIARVGMDSCFRAEPVGDAVFARMLGKSYPKDCPVARCDLRYVRVLHYDWQGRVLTGELVCHRQIADDVVQVFRQLYRQKYPIGSVRLIDDFDADDERSMRANNTSCFCYRSVNGSQKLSKHARGLAVDINPLYNPCRRRTKNGRWRVEPATAVPYCDRTKTFRGKIDRQDLCYRLFTARGFTWGGNWRALKDWQHFEK